MDRNTSVALSLPQELANNIWRIIGNDESPLTQETTLRLIEQTIRKCAQNLSLAQQDEATAVVHAWFEFHGEKGWLKEDMKEPVAHLIIDGIKNTLSTQTKTGNRETAFCAVGSIEPDIAFNIIRGIWTNREIEEFASYAFKVLESLCNKDAVLNPDRHMRLEGAKSKVSLNENVIQGEGRLQTLLRLRDHDWWLHSCIANMIELLVKLNPDYFYTLIEKVDNPVIHLRAARCLIDQYAASDCHRPLQWLTNTPSDALIALGMVHILEDVNRLDSNFRLNTERRTEQADLELTASCLLSGMVDQLDNLEPISRARWIGELLDSGISALNPVGHCEKSRRVEQFEGLCVQQIKRLVHQSWSEALLDEFRVGMCLAPLVPRILPLAQVALDIRETDLEQSAEIARMLLDTLVERIAETLDGAGTFFYNLKYWTYCDWVNGLGTALVLSDREVSLPEWVSERCRALPLSAWDAEENFQRFLTAEKVARFQFLVALTAIQIRKDIGHTLDPASTLALAEDLWAHGQFVRLYLRPVENSDVAEYAARIAILFGEPDNEWVLRQASNGGVAPRTLWALIDQEIPNGVQRPRLHGDRQLLDFSELRRIAFSRFGDVRGLGLTELHYLGKLWFLLGAVDEARETAMAIVSLPQQNLDRAHRIIALKLLAFAASARRIGPEAEKEIASLYSNLWSSYTPAEEREERRQIDDLLKR